MAIDYFANAPPGLDLTESRTASNNAIGIVLFILSLIFVLLRLFVRMRMKHEPLGLDDYLMVLGLALSAGNLACCLAGGHFGLGKHIWSLDHFQMRQITIITFAYVFIYAWSVCIIKFSILALYRRIFGLSWLGYCCIGLTIGYLIANHVVLPLYTQPLSYYWNQWYGADGKIMINEAKFYLGVGIINLFGDICILAVPISNVLKLHMGKSQKIATCFIFLLGSFVCFASLYRIITITRLVHSKDISWAKSDVFIWSSVEPSIGIISGCLPTLGPLLIFLLQPWRKLTKPTGKSSSTEQGSMPNQMNTLETISKKRTRKIFKRDELESLPLTQLEDDVEVKQDGKMVLENARCPETNFEHSGSWRPDDEEMCLTTTTIKRGVSQTGGLTGEDHTIDGKDRDGITLTKKFEWDEATRHQDVATH
ncbi:hypothetical protein BDU57DRAFT_489397 [Ampelomyces quisqualis]|uniref:Rhodopsin domain-containing protein n=1 Tax=Ampelomyces quisqualis TaxID=50730 RepID=A0A6A5R0F1_AMPQU|nr:hypothetical protein BDU57DRAFT_489397 [Ampelomyces quisqualis]